MPSTASTSTEIAMKRWRGIMLGQSLFVGHFLHDHFLRNRLLAICSAPSWFVRSWFARSWSGSQLGTNVGDSARDGDGNDLLVVRRHEWRNIGPRRGNFDSDGRRDDVI